MTDAKFTKIAGSLLYGMRDLVNWGIAGDHTSTDDLTLEVRKAEKRIEAVKLVNAGASVRDAAKITGIPKSTVHDDAVRNSGKDVRNPDVDFERSSPKPKPNIPPGKFATIVIDPPWPMAKIERDVRAAPRLGQCWRHGQGQGSCVLVNNPCVLPVAAVHVSSVASLRLFDGFLAPVGGTDGTRRGGTNRTPFKGGVPFVPVQPGEHFSEQTEHFCVHPEHCFCSAV